MTLKEKQIEKLRSLNCKDLADKIQEIIDHINEYQPKKLEFEDHNFQVNSDGWHKITVNGDAYLENETKDAWEFLEGEYSGEQLFTWDAAKRETEKAGKRMPTDEEFTELLQTKDDMPNVVYAGYRSTDGSFYNQGTNANLWSASESSATNGWNRTLSSGHATVLRNGNAKANGFSVRCFK